MYLIFHQDFLLRKKLRTVYLFRNCSQETVSLVLNPFFRSQLGLSVHSGPECLLHSVWQILRQSINRQESFILWKVGFKKVFNQTSRSSFREIVPENFNWLNCYFRESAILYVKHFSVHSSSGVRPDDHLGLSFAPDLSTTKNQ